MARIKAQFKAGDIVQIKEDAFEERWDSAARARQLEDHIYANYHCTAEDTERWREAKYKATQAALAKGEDTFSINFDDAGESRLPGVSVIVDIPAGRVYEVLRARCRARLSYGNPTPGLMKLLDTETGREIYVKRDYMEAV